MPVTQRMTAEEYLALPGPPELLRTELVDGELIVHEPKPLHQLVVARAPSFDVPLELERAGTLTPPLLEGFELPLGALFPPPE